MGKDDICTVAKRPRRLWLFGLLVAASSAMAAALTSVPAAQANHLPAVSGEPGGLLRILAPDDIDRVQRIFRSQRTANWALADRDIKLLENRILVGHILGQRYLHPDRYRASYRELHDWLQDYRDHPGADGIYRLALKKRPQGAPMPPLPTGAAIISAPEEPIAPPDEIAELDIGGGTEFLARIVPRPRGANDARLVMRAEITLKENLRARRPDLAEKLLERKDITPLLSPSEFDDWRRRIAAGYFLAGEDVKSWQLATAAAARSRDRVPGTDWIVGLSAWRLGKFEAAAEAFSWLAGAQGAPTRQRSAGAYWAARSLLRMGRPEGVNRLLQQAAEDPYTFYGLLATRQLGWRLPFDWTTPPLTPDEARKLVGLAGVKRAVALHETNEHVLAERELKRLAGSANGRWGQALIGLAEHLQAPAAALSLARTLRENRGDKVDSALYPLPPWQPENGFQLDRALVFAFMRQESGFNSRAKSPAGASGLMQLMPSTASFIAGDTSLKLRQKDKLFAPEFNIELGQRYLQHLIENPVVRGGLLHLAAAYNAGPGNLQRWSKEGLHQDDPILFIETLPSAETRNFIERVLANLWIYRARFEQDQPELDAVAAGEWPLYRSLDRRYSGSPLNAAN
jgi:soluble lytic murein transglycosylase